jgi:hypothetical protein
MSHHTWSRRWIQVGDKGTSEIFKVVGAKLKTTPVQSLKDVDENLEDSNKLKHGKCQDNFKLV